MSNRSKSKPITPSKDLLQVSNEVHYLEAKLTLQRIQIEELKLALKTRELQLEETIKNDESKIHVSCTRFLRTRRYFLLSCRT